MKFLQEWVVLDISLWSWGTALLAAILTYAVLDVGTRVLARRMAMLSQRALGHSQNIVSNTLAGTKRILIFLLAILVGLNMLDLPLRVESRLAQAWVVVIGIQVAIWLNRAITGWAEKVIDSGDKPDLRKRATTTTMVFLIRLVVMLVVVLAVLANLGINITAFVASLGIGGVAIALALQSILSDLFASLAIGLDKPFEVGDFIIVDEVMLGTVEYIGVKTTRLRSLGGEQLVRSNTELLKSVIRNYKRMSERRVVFGFGIRYETPVEKVGLLGAEVRKIVEAIEMARFDRAHFAKFGASSLDFEVVYYVLSSDFNVYMDIQQRINLELMQVCKKHGILFARPTSILHFDSEIKLATPQTDMKHFATAPD
jgi:small-conductance mechanosensitive channel